jgi:hypothetical protein
LKRIRKCRWRDKMLSNELLLQLPEGWDGIDGLDQSQEDAGSSFPRARELHVSIGPDARYKMGTCEHCVVFEHGRPDRAWNAEGDKDLDFERDRYFAYLAKLGIVMTDRQAYVCP